jgi:hypothetical protein
LRKILNFDLNENANILLSKKKSPSRILNPERVSFST